MIQKLIRAMASSLQANFDNDGYYVDQKLIICSKRTNIEKYLRKSKRPTDSRYEYSDKISDLYVVGLLNSRLFHFFYKKTLKKGISILPDDIRNLPIFPNLDSQDFDIIVSKIISLKKHNFSADTAALESQIDQLVYKLYGLTQEEITMIENA